MIIRKILLFSIMHYALCIMHCLLAFPISNYDFTLPHTTPSAIEASLGGMHIASSDDYFLPITNPALLKKVKQATLAFTFGTAPDEYETFSNLLHAEPLLEGGTMRSISYQAKSFGIAFKNLASTEKTVIDPLQNTQTYTSYSLSSYTIAFADSVGRFDWGLSGKLINGRLVYLDEPIVREDANIPRVYEADGVVNTRDQSNTFIDSDALGYSFDLGVTTHTGNITYAMMLYDIYSAIHWEKQKTAHIRTRLGAGVDYSNEYNSLGMGLNSRWWFRGEPFYNVYYSRIITEQFPSQLHQSSIRVGLLSSDFLEQDHIIFCFGVGYEYKMISLDIGLQSRGIKANETQIFLSLTLGE